MQCVYERTHWDGWEECWGKLNYKHPFRSFHISAADSFNDYMQ